MQSFQPLVAIVDFHHLRGPEVEQWFGLADDQVSPPQYEEEWSLLPFLALPDGAHSSDEEISYFTLKDSSGEGNAAPTSLFGISCTRSLSAALLAQRNPEVTRSAVQKAIVAIVPSPGLFARIREKLSAVTKAWFAQANFEDSEIIGLFWEDLVLSCSAPLTPQPEDDSKDKGEGRNDSMDDYVGLSLRQIVYTWRHDFLILFKSLLLQKRVLFFGSHCEKLCLLQFSLVSLVPGLIRQLHDCADPSFSAHADEVQQQAAPSSLQTSSRANILAYMGLPLQLFGKGAMFGPYTPLQQLSLLEDSAGGTKSFVAGSTNALLIRRSPGSLYDVLVNMDEGTVEISDDLKPALALTLADKRFMELIVASVTETWDERHPTRPSTLGYAGSEEWIRLQFEEYLLAFLSCVAAYEADKASPPEPTKSLSAPRASMQKSHSRSPSRSPSPAAPQPSTTAPALDGNEKAPSPASPSEPPPNPTPWTDFSQTYLSHFLTTPAAHLFTHLTAPTRLPIPLPALTPARHPCASPNSPLAQALTQLHSDLAARLAALHLDAKLARASETLQRRLGEGRERVGSAVAGLWAELEARRTARELERANAEIARDAMVGMQRAKQREVAAALGRPETPGAEAGFTRWSRDAGSMGGSPQSQGGSARKRESGGGGGEGLGEAEDGGGDGGRGVRPSLEAAGQRASAYFSSWSTWAAEKRRGGGQQQQQQQREADGPPETIHSHSGSRDEDAARAKDEDDR